jgi:hypothetical protein
MYDFVFLPVTGNERKARRGQQYYWRAMSNSTVKLLKDGEAVSQMQNSFQ